VTSATTLTASLLLPLLGAILVAATGRWPNIRETATLSTAILLFVLVCSLWPSRFDGIDQIVLLEPVPGGTLALHLEPLGMLFALVASFLWIITSLYAIGYMRAQGESNQTRFYTAFAVAMAATMGVAFAANLFTLFVFYEILTLSTYPLVTHSGTEKARRAGRVYLGILLTTSTLLLLPAVIATWLFAGTLDFKAGGILQGRVSNAVAGMLLLLYFFGIGKSAAMPFHRWLPAAMVAPTPVSALLHAVAVVKAGVFSMLKVTTYVFGTDLLSGISISQWLIYVSLATILLASLVALRQDNLKRRLAYSTISQLGYILLAGQLGNATGLIGGGLHIANHAFGKITLFLAAGAILVATHKTEVSAMSGLGRRMPLTFACFLVGSLSVIGLPPLGGFWSKWYLLLGSLRAEQWLAMLVLIISSLLNVAYLLPVSVRGFFSAPLASGDETFNPVPWPCRIAMAITASGCILLFLAAGPLVRLLETIGL